MAKKSSRFVHSTIAAQGNLNDKIFSIIDPRHQTLLEQRGIPETNTALKQREIVKCTKPLKKFRDNPLGDDDHELEVHQALWIDPYLWEFQKGKERPDGTHSLQIGCSTNYDESVWSKLEGGDFFEGTDSEVYNSMRGYKKAKNKNYGLHPWGGDCQRGAYDVRDHLMSGQSKQSPAPIRDAGKILANKLLTKGPGHVVMRALKSGVIHGSHKLSPGGYDAFVEDAMQDMMVVARDDQWM